MVRIIAVVVSSHFAEAVALLLLAAALVCTVSAPAALAAEPVTMTGSLELTPNYRPTAWQPVRLEIRNESDRAIDGAAVVPVGGGSTAATMRLPVRVPPKSLVRLRVAGYFPRLELNSSKKQQAEVPP